MKRKIVKIMLFFLALFALTAALFCCTTAEGTTIGGMDVGGKTAAEVLIQLRRAEDSLQKRELTIRLPEQTFTLFPDPRIPKARLTFAAFFQRDLPLDVHYSRSKVRSRLEAYAEAYDSTLTPSGYWLEGPSPNLSTREFDGSTQTLILDPGTPERHLDIPAALEALDRFYSQLFLREGYSLILETPAQAEPEALDLDAIFRELDTPPVNDTLDMQTYAQIPGSYGYTFDLAEAKRGLKEGAVRISMEAIEPEILGEAVYFRDELGHCETRHTQDENRNTNLRLMCQALNGVVIQPGEEFSYNGSVGERTAAKGYKPAGAYSGNRLVQDIGGGVCQGSTTLYNCALQADLEILERHGHGFTVNYVPIGLDAAVNWATKTDLRFRNNWNFPMMITAEVSDGFVRMRLLGTDEKDYSIQMTSTRSDTELRIYSSSYKHKYDKETGQEISKELEARSSYMYMQ